MCVNPILSVSPFLSLSISYEDNGLGMRVVGGLEIPGGRGEIGAFVTEISPGGVVDTHGEVQEGRCFFNEFNLRTRHIN